MTGRATFKPPITDDEFQIGGRWYRVEAWCPAEKEAPASWCIYVSQIPAPKKRKKGRA